MSDLLTRDEFRASVFERDGHKCVICKDEAQDAHHIIERRLFKEGGYYIDNGVSVCGPCHLKAEATLLSCEDLREAAGITNVVLPDHLYPDERYDKWGNPILSNELRVRGELFNDASVQKVLAPVLHLFTSYVKYPRTYHVPWSPGVSKSDRVLESMDHFFGKEVVVTEKMDGENTTLYRDHIHARSVEPDDHESRHWVKNFHSQIAHEIPESWHIVGENMFAKHAIAYTDLPSYFLGFSVWGDKNICLSWDETLEWFNLLSIIPVPVLWEGLYNEEAIRNLVLNTETQEGFVIRVRSEFPYSAFRQSVAKYVREGHVQTSEHWKRTWTRNTIQTDVRPVVRMGMHHAFRKMQKHESE